MPTPRHGLGGQTFARSLHAQKQQALGWVNSLIGALSRERGAPQFQPMFEVVESADEVKTLCLNAKFNQPVFAGVFSFEIEDPLQVHQRQPPIVTDTLRHQSAHIFFV